MPYNKQIHAVRVKGEKNEKKVDVEIEEDGGARRAVAQFPDTEEGVKMANLFISALASSENMVNNTEDVVAPSVEIENRA